MYDRSPLEPFQGAPPEEKGKDPVHTAAFRAAVEGADTYLGIRSALRRDGPTVRLGNRFVPIAKYREIAFLAVGHAAVSAAYAAHDALGPAITQGLVVGPNPLPNDVPFRHIQVGAGRPGREGSVPAVAESVELAEGLGARDLLLLLVTPGAVVGLAGAPPGFDAGSWSRWLGSVRDAGATSRETAEVVRALGTGGVGGGIARSARAAEVVPLVVDRGEGGVLVGGGPSVPVAAEERTAARSALSRLGVFDKLPATAQELLRPNGALPSGTGPNVQRPVAVAGPADALRSAGEALAARGYVTRLAAMSTGGAPEVAAASFLPRVDEVLERTGTPKAPTSKGVVVFGPATFEVPEGDDERATFPRFAEAVAPRIRRRGMTVGAYQTSALATPKGAAGIVVESSSPGAPAVVRPLPMRSGVTDVGCLMVAVVPAEPAT